MKTYLKIILLGFVAVIAALVFIVFFYPDEKLQDLSDLDPVIRDVLLEENAYYLVEEAGKNIKKSQWNAGDMILFLTDKPTLSKKQVIDDEYVGNFLLSEEPSIKLLERAEQLPYYQNPKINDNSTVDLLGAIPSSSNSIKIRTLYIKGLYELKSGQDIQSLQTILDALNLATKMRAGSFSMMEYLISDSIIKSGKEIIRYFENRGMITKLESENVIESVKDDGWKEYINVLKFEFQHQKNMLSQIEGENNLIAQNHFNFRKNATINAMAVYMRNLIDEARHYDCSSTETIKPTRNERSQLVSIVSENGIGKTFISAISIANKKAMFCE